MTLIVVPDIVGHTPLQRSLPKLERAVEVINNKRVTVDNLQEDFARYMASVLKARVKRSIYSQKLGSKSMKQVYKPLSTDYQTRKLKVNKDKFWINTGFLVENLQMWKSGNTYRVGFKNSIKYPGTNTKLAQVIVWLEKGTKKIPARPLFTVHSKYMMKHIDVFFNHYLKIRFNIK